MDTLHDKFYGGAALIGGFITLFGLVSLFVKEHLFLAESLVSTLFGVLIGPKALNLVEFDIDSVTYLTQQFTRVVISFQVMEVGVTLSANYVKRAWKSIAIFLGPLMLLMWFTSAIIIKFILGIGWREALIIGACATPTDPVLAASVLKGKFSNKYIPTHLKNLLAAESGVNDGLGLPFMMLPVLLIAKEAEGGTAEALKDWFLDIVLYEVILSIVIGIICGFGARFLLKKSIKYNLIDKESFLVFNLALALFVTGATALIHSDDLLAVFIAGSAFSWDDQFKERAKDSHFQEVIDLVFNCTFFVYFGMILPWNNFFSGPFPFWKLLLMVVGILLFRRLPYVMLLQPVTGELRSMKEAFFAGWFGPMGVGALFFTTVVKDVLDTHSNPISEDCFTVVCFIVLSSVIIHSITVPFTHIHLKTRARRKRRKATSKKQVDNTVDATDTEAEDSETGESSVKLSELAESELRKHYNI